MRTRWILSSFSVIALLISGVMFAYGEEANGVSFGAATDFVQSLPQDMRHQLSLMSEAEKTFCLEVLAKITAQYSRDDVIALLGKPHRNVAGLKLNWWVELKGHKDRVGVYFSPRGTVTEIVLDGGSGRFYYRYRIA